MAIADLQERKTLRIRGLRFAHNPERVGHTAGNGPQYTGAAPRHAFQDLAAIDPVSLVDFTHFANLLSAAAPAIFAMRLARARLDESQLYSRAGEEN